MVRRAQGKTKLMFLPMTASTAVSGGTLMTFSSGKLIAATSTTAGHEIIGVLRHTIAATDSDYATDARLVEVEVPVEKNVVWEIDVTSGLVAADVGTYDDLTDGATVNRGASTYDIAYCVKVISSTKGQFILNIGPDADAKT